MRPLSQISFRILGVPVLLSGPPAIVDPIGAAYRRFIERASTSPSVSVRVLPEPDPAIIVNGRTMPLARGLDALLQVYAQFLAAVLDAVETHAMFHAAVLATPDREGVLVAAPTGHGKTSLSLALVRRGFGFLSDDYAPVEVPSGRVAPFLRALGVVVDGTAPIPPEFAAAAAAPHVPTLMGKALLDVGEVLGERSVVHDPVKLRHVVVLSDDAAGSLDPGDTWVEVALLSAAAEAFDRSVEAIAGVETTERAALDGAAMRTLKLRGDGAAVAALDGVLQADGVLSARKYWNRRPDFEGTPSVAPIRRTDAALLLGREMLNRRRSSRFLARYGGDTAALFLDLAGVLRDVGCWRVTLGRFEATAEAIASLVSPSD